VRVAIGVEGDGTGIEARLFDAVNGEEIDRAHGQNAVALHTCADNATRTLRIEARATAGKLDAIIGERTTTFTR
jgi:hypothetical protein